MPPSTITHTRRASCHIIQFRSATLALRECIVYDVYRVMCSHMKDDAILATTTMICSCHLRSAYIYIENALKRDHSAWWTSILLWGDRADGIAKLAYIYVGCLHATRCCAICKCVFVRACVRVIKCVNLRWYLLEISTAEKLVYIVVVVRDHIV